MTDAGTATPSWRDARVAAMATFAPRFANLPRVVASLAPQVDALLIYVNDAPADFPDLSRWSNVHVFFAKDWAGDLSANGKMHHLNFLENCYVYTVDDDFIFPPDYVARLTDLLDRCQRRCCVAVHGSIFPPTVRWYYERTTVFASQRSLRRHQLVTLAGSGAFAFHQSTLPVRFDDFRSKVMVDLRLSREARRHGLPIFAVARPEGWLRFLGGEGLWEAFRGRLTHHTAEARRHDWSFEAYRRLTLAMFERVFGGFDVDSALALGLDEELVGGLATGATPAAWRLQLLSYQRRTQYLKLLAQGARLGS
jgi:hypothetical protein